MPLVSFKFFLVRLWYVAIFYFFAITIFKDISSLKPFVILFTFSMLFAIVYTLINHSTVFFAQDMANKVTKPFFKDHTVYGATMALVFPFIVGITFKAKTLGFNRLEQYFFIFSTIVFIPGIIFSYTRAAWVSLAVSFIFFLVLWMKIRFKTLVVSVLLVIFILTIFWSKIMFLAERNEKISSSDLKEHVESITNISTDPSNSERINRWKCAVRMFKQKPLLGWGPGTYMFQYAPFQLSYEKTIISTNFGNLGNAHSEYLGPLAESGLLGMLSFLAIVIFVIYKSMDLYYHASTQKHRLHAALLLLCLVTYISHGLMNNFLDTDKASVPFWSFIAMLTALDIYYPKNKPLK